MEENCSIGTNYPWDFQNFRILDLEIPSPFILFNQFYRPPIRISLCIPVDEIEMDEYSIRRAIDHPINFDRLFSGTDGYEILKIRIDPKEVIRDFFMSEFSTTDPFVISRSIRARRLIDFEEMYTHEVFYRRLTNYASDRVRSLYKDELQRTYATEIQKLFPHGPL